MPLVSDLLACKKEFASCKAPSKSPPPRPAHQSSRPSPLPSARTPPPDSPLRSGGLPPGASFAFSFRRWGLLAPTQRRQSNWASAPEESLRGSDLQVRHKPHLFVPALATEEMILHCPQ